MTTDASSTHSSMPHAISKGVPAFLQSLYHIVSDEGTNELIHWSQDGDSFFVQEPDRFAREELGQWFKHKNYSSFVRQLNNYGFNKIPHLQQGTLRSNGNNEYNHYAHPEFRRDRQDLLRCIQRKGQVPPDHPDQSQEVRDPSHNASIKKEDSARAEMIPATDISQGQLLNTIMLEVDTLKSRSMELEADNKYLRDEVRGVQVAMRQQQELILRLLASFGVVPTTGHHWTRGQDKLMIQGVENEKLVTVTEINEETNTMVGLTDGLNGDGIISSPPSSPSSPPVSSPSRSPGVLNHSTACLGLGSVDDTATPLDTTGSGLLTQALGYSEDLMDSLPPSESLQVFSETESYSFDANNWDFDDPSAGDVSGLNQNYGMGEICPDFFNHCTSSDTRSCDVPTTASGPSLDATAIFFTPSASGNSGAPFDPGNTTRPTVSAISRKRKASMVDESQHAGPECAPRPSPSSLSPYGTQTPTDLICPTVFPALRHDQSVEETIHPTYPWFPSGDLVLDTSASTLLPSSIEGNKSPKRAKRG